MIDDRQVTPAADPVRPQDSPRGTASADAQADPAAIPWADIVPDPALVRWLEGHPCPRPGHRALVLGCGLGDDAEELARCAMHVIALDRSPTAVRWCQERFPSSPVDYRVGTLLEAPKDWDGSFDLVMESCTLHHHYPLQDRGPALRHMAALVAPGGTLLLLERGACVDGAERRAQHLLRGEDRSPLTSQGLVAVAEFELPSRSEPTASLYYVEYARPAR